MATPETYLGFGTIISAIGMALVCFNVTSHRRHHADDQLSEFDRRFFDRQYSRRMQTSALAVTLGALIALCGYLKAFEDSLVFATIYVIGLLVLALWLIFLALTDALTSRVYASKLGRHRPDMHKSLQQALAEVRQAHGLDQRN